jgi:hypothetical protein
MTMQTAASILIKSTLCVTLALAASLGAGCQSTAPKPSGFLSNYGNLVKVSDSSWRYVDAGRLAACDKFTTATVKVLVKDYAVAPLTSEEQQQAADRLRQALAKALAGRCQLVSQPGPNTAEIRAAITAAYPVGTSFTLGLEGEIVDASGQQLAALREFQAGSPQPTGGPVSLDTSLNRRFWDRVSAISIMEDFAGQMAGLIESSHKH